MYIVYILVCLSIQCVLLQFTTNTFQGVLITDGSTSYAVFLYHCPSMEWSRNAVIGWQASSSRYRNHPLSGNSDASEVACLNPDSSYNTVIFQLNSVGKSLYTPHSLFYTPSVTCSLWDSRPFHRILYHVYILWLLQWPLYLVL